MRRGIEGIRFGVLEGSLCLLCLEGGGRLGRGDLGGINALSKQIVIDGVNRKPGNMVLEKSRALGEEMLDTLCVAAWGEGLPVSVLLVAKSASCRTSCTAGVLGIALEAVSGNCRRARPTELALIFLLLHLAQASWERRRRRVPGDVVGASSWLSWALRLRFGWGWELSCVGGGSMRRRDGVDTRLVSNRPSAPSLGLRLCLSLTTPPRILSIS